MENSRGKQPMGQDTIRIAHYIVGWKIKEA